MRTWGGGCARAIQQQRRAWSIFTSDKIPLIYASPSGERLAFVVFTSRSQRKLFAAEVDVSLCHHLVRHTSAMHPFLVILFFRVYVLTYIYVIFYSRFSSIFLKLQEYCKNIDSKQTHELSVGVSRPQQRST